MLQVHSPSPGQSDNVSDTSDDPTTGAANDPTVVTITTSPSIRVLKSVSVTDNGDGKLGKGDILQYDISVENTGDVTLKSVTVTDTLTDGNSSTMSLSRVFIMLGLTEDHLKENLKWEKKLII